MRSPHRDEPGGDERVAGPLDRLRQLVPASLVGPARRPAWQRTRLRRAACAVLLGTAVWVAMSAFVPRPAPRGVPVVVVSQDLLAGHVLSRGDLTVADWPPDLSPAGATADPGPLVGRALGAGMMRGEALTPARVRGPGLLAGAANGLVAAHVRLADPAMAAMATSGDHVDLISPAGRLVASDVVVLAVDSGSTGGTWSPTPAPGLPGGVIVAVPSQAAIRLATADPSGLSESTFSLVMRDGAEHS